MLLARTGKSARPREPGYRSLISSAGAAISLVRKAASSGGYGLADEYSNKGERTVGRLVCFRSGGLIFGILFSLILLVVVVVVDSPAVFGMVFVHLAR
jgi:hypothetical protein